MTTVTAALGEAGTRRRMRTKVYQFGLLPMIDGEDRVRAQLRAAHDYRNELISIERGRRHALRAIDDASPDVGEAKDLVRTATRSTRRAAISVLRDARKVARAACSDRLERIAELDASIRRDARALTTCFWGTYLDIEARHQQARSAPLYGDDSITPSDPAYHRGPRWRDAFAPSDPRGTWWLHVGQLGMQIQGGITTLVAVNGTDRRVRLELGPANRRGRRYGTLWLRVGSDGREPIWAAWPIKTHRDIPPLAMWKWVRVSVRAEACREIWTVEITVDLPVGAEATRERGRGSIAVEWEWSPIEGGGIRVARWADDAGGSGEVTVPAQIVTGINKPNGIRAVRDLIMNSMRDEITAHLASDKTRLPPHVAREAATIHLWKSSNRFRALAMHWRRCPDTSSRAYAMLDSWEKRDAHLYAYEAGARSEALRERREFYRVLAAKWRKQYARVLLSDQDLSKEARWGDDGDIRFTASVSELRTCLEQAFGDDAVKASWRDAPDADDARSWCERTRDAWVAGGARGDGRFAQSREKTTNAWAARRGRRARSVDEAVVARNPNGNSSETQA